MGKGLGTAVCNPTRVSWRDGPLLNRLIVLQVFSCPLSNDQDYLTCIPVKKYNPYGCPSCVLSGVFSFHLVSSMYLFDFIVQLNCRSVYEQEDTAASTKLPCDRIQP